MEIRLRQASRLPLAPAEFWHGLTLADVNAELGPWLRMTAPVAWRDRPLQQWPQQPALFASWLLLGGLWPLDRHRFGTLRLLPGQRGFVEQSSSLWLRAWRHERRTEPQPGGCLLTDEVRFTPRRGLPAALLAPIYRAAFAHRHRRLRARLGGTPA